MRLVLLLGTAIAAVMTVAVWRSQHAAEVWHVAPDAPA